MATRPKLTESETFEKYRVSLENVENWSEIAAIMAEFLNPEGFQNLQGFANVLTSFCISKPIISQSPVHSPPVYALS